MLKRRVQSKRLNKTVAANRRKRKLANTKEKSANVTEFTFISLITRNFVQTSTQ